MEKIKVNQKYVLRSKKASLICSFFHSVETIPIWFARRRSTAKSLSCSLRNLAVVGSSGMKRLDIISKPTLISGTSDLQDYAGKRNGD